MRPRLRRQLRGGARGFTLIELIVVMVIVTIAFLAVRPQFGKALNANRDRAALRRVVAVLTSAHADAVSEGRLVRVIIAPEQMIVWAEIQSNPQLDRSQFDPLPVLGKGRLSWPEALAIDEMDIGGIESRGRGDCLLYTSPSPRD